jgi:uncharacterized protein DUF1707
VSDPSSLRAADSDREQLAGELREHMLAGRLSSEEFEQRLEKAYAASTRGDLDALRSDLPISPVLLRGELAKRRAHLRRRLIQEAGGGLTASAVCVVIWLSAGAGGSFWPAWVILFSLLPLIRDAWRLFGPAPDLESVERHLDARRSHPRHERHRHRDSGSPRLPR